MLRKICVLGVVVGLALVLVPGMVAAQSDYSITIRLWQGESPWPGRYTIGETTGVTLYYFWYATTEEQVQDFLDHAVIEITLDDESLFASAEAAAMWWEDIEPFEFQGASIWRAKWMFELESMTVGVHTFETVIALDDVVEDGLAAKPFAAGPLHETTNLVSVVGANGPAWPASVAPSELVVTTTTNDGGSTILPTLAPSVGNPAPEVVVPTPAVVYPTVTPVPQTAPQETWLPKEATFGGRVVGTVTDPARAYYQPFEGKFVDPTIVFQPGETLWVYGLDPTYQFYMVIIDEAYIWIPAWTIGPTQDSVWNGTPLPSVIIDPNSGNY